MRKCSYLIPVMGILLYSCKVTQSYKTPDVNTSGLYRDVSGTDTTTMAAMPWREMFTDTLLQKLISTGINNNLDLKVAYSRVREAQAYLQQSSQAFLPAVNAGVNATYNTSSDLQVSGANLKKHQYQGTVTAGWEADIWGKLKSARLANLSAVLQAGYNARAVQTGLVAGIATCYYQLLVLDQQLSVTEKSVQNWQTTVDVMRELKKSDIVTGAAIVQSEASKYATAATIPDLKQSIRETENQLNILLGRAPAAIERSTLDVQHIAGLLNTGVPFQLLAYRPDVQAAEQNFRYYFELTNVARANFYPALTISASAGYLENSLAGPGAFISGLTGGLLQPVFNQGINRTKMKAAREQQQQALLNFNSILLSSGQEVSNSLYSYQAASEKMEVRKDQLLNLEKSVAYTQQLVRYGFANYTEVLTAQQSMLSAQLSAANDRLQQLEAVVSLYRALGGGWK